MKETELVLALIERMSSQVKLLNASPLKRPFQVCIPRIKLTPGTAIELSWYVSVNVNILSIDISKDGATT